MDVAGSQSYDATTKPVLARIVAIHEAVHCARFEGKEPASCKSEEILRPKMLAGSLSSVNDFIAIAPKTNSQSEFHAINVNNNESDDSRYHSHAAVHFLSNLLRKIAQGLHPRWPVEYGRAR